MSGAAATGTRIGAPGLAPEDVVRRLAAVREELARASDPVAARLAALDAAALRMPLEQDEGDEEIFESYRRMLRHAAVAERPPLTTHRRLLGPFVLAFKRLVWRVVRFDVEPALERQEAFNRAAIDLVRLLLTEVGRLRARVRELERGPGRRDGTSP